MHATQGLAAVGRTELLAALNVLIGPAGSKSRPWAPAASSSSGRWVEFTTVPRPTISVIRTEPRSGLVLALGWVAWWAGRMPSKLKPLPPPIEIRPPTWDEAVRSVRRR